MKKIIKLLALAFVFSGIMQAPRAGGMSKKQLQAKAPGCFSGIFGRKNRVVPVDEAPSPRRSPRRLSESSTTRELREAENVLMDARKLFEQMNAENHVTMGQVRKHRKSLTKNQARIDAALSGAARKKTPSQEAAEYEQLERELNELVRQ